MTHSSFDTTHMAQTISDAHMIFTPSAFLRMDAGYLR